MNTLSGLNIEYHLRIQSRSTGSMLIIFKYIFYL